MFPLLRSGDILLCSSSASCKVGDIILFKQDQELIAHRVLSLSPHLQSKGDWSLNLDKKSPPVLALVQAIKRGEKILIFTQQNKKLKAWLAVFSARLQATTPRPERYLLRMIIWLLAQISLHLVFAVAPANGNDVAHDLK